MPSLTIKQTAQRAGVGVETLRFYEREGLVPEPPRTSSGYRQYPPETIRRIRFIKRAQSLGFTLPEVRELLTLTVLPGATAADVRARATQKIADIELKITTLERMKSALQRVTQACHGAGPLETCPILEALTQEED